MNRHYNPELVRKAQELRKNMTKEERRLWYVFLKKIPQNVNSQKIIDGYIVDFYIASAKLIIEIDGSQHYNKAKAGEDEYRDFSLKNMGYRVLRYTNMDINQRFEQVCEDILRCINENK